MIGPLRPIALSLVGVVALGCGAPSAREVGAQLFADPRFSLSDANQVACATCHAESDADVAGRILPGGSLAGVTARPHYWGGTVRSSLDATNVCVTRFMRGAALTRDEPRSRALYEHLASLGGGDGAPLPLTIVENITTSARGDPRVGGDVYARACLACHGEAHSGTGALPGMVIVPEASRAFAEQSGFPTDLVVIEKVRHGGFFGVGGVMPPFSVEVLSNEDLAALLAFLDL